jgi:hypothetical protein
VGTPPTNAVQRSVPPDIEKSQSSGPSRSYDQSNPSGESGEPVDPREPRRERSRPARGSIPAFMHAARKLADVPKHVTPASSARSHSVPRSGWPGFPSYRTIEASVRRPAWTKFHIIQPVVVNQKSRSSRWRSRCRFRVFSSSRRIPPWPWTIAFGRPVVPEL